MNEREEACKTYFNLAKKKIVGLRKGLDNQFYAYGLRDVWSSFDGLLGLKFTDINQKEELKKFNLKYNLIWIDWRMSDQFKKSLLKMKKFSPIMNMKNGKIINFDDEKNLLEILTFCYGIRSNLNHGAKDLERQDDLGVKNRELVENALKVTYEILEKALPLEGINV
jgi:hypothetical protein